MNMKAAILILLATGSLLSFAATARGESASLQIIDVTQLSPSSAAWNMDWSDAYSSEAESCDETATFADGQTVPSKDGYGEWFSIAEANPAYDPNGDEILNRIVGIRSHCVLLKTVYYRQWWRATRWTTRNGAAIASRSGDCQSYEYLPGALTIDCRHARRGEVVTWRIRHRGRFDRCSFSFVLRYSSPGARHFSCRDASKRVAAVRLNVRPGGRLTVSDVSIRFHYRYWTTESREVEVDAYGTWSA
jgi:hypothetical protein